MQVIYILITCHLSFKNNYHSFSLVPDEELLQHMFYIFKLFHVNKLQILTPTKKGNTVQELSSESFKKESGGVHPPKLSQ